MAPLIRFLVSTILFSLTSNYDKILKEELWTCHKYMNLTMEEIYNMPRLDRKNYIKIHNKLTQEENNKFKKR